MKEQQKNPGFLTSKAYEACILLIIRLFNSASWVYKFVPENTSYPSPTIRNAKRKGIRYELDVSDYQEWLVYFHCNSDSSLHVLNDLGNATVILDIGANIGQTALNIIRNQKAKGIHATVHAFEPYPSTFQKLRRNVTLNETQQVIIHNLGVGAESGTLRMMQHCDTNSGGFRIATADSGEQNIEVPITTVDEFVRSNALTAIDFVKIDVEGYEYHVILGMHEVLNTYQPVLIFEYLRSNIVEQGGNPEELFAQLQRSGYSFRTKEGETNLNSILHSVAQTDIICTPIR